jgi:hypothetical protein
MTVKIYEITRSFYIWPSYRRLMSSHAKIFFAIPIVIMICFAGTLQAYASTFPPPSAQAPLSESSIIPVTTQPPSGEDTKGNKSTSPKIFTKILYDDDNGHMWGWDPDSLANTFLINETLIDRLSSTVLVNTYQNGWIICVTDFLTDQFFEVICNKPPPQGAQLRYTVINGEQLQPPAPSVIKELQERYSNVSKDIKLGPVSCDVKPTRECANIPILSKP